MRHLARKFLRYMTWRCPKCGGPMVNDVFWHMACQNTKFDPPQCDYEGYSV